MPIAVGLYLPFGLAFPILIGGLVERLTRAEDSDAGRMGGSPGVLFASGAVAGEALVGVGVAVAVGLGIGGGSADYAGAGLVTLVVAIASIGLFARATRA